MAVSAITVTNLVATGALGAIALSWSYTTPPGQGCLSYMQPESFEVYSSVIDFFGDPDAPAANYEGKVRGTSFTKTGLGAEEGRYLWVRAVDPIGFVGEVSDTVYAETLEAPASQADLDAAQIEYTALVNTEKTQRQSADGALASTVTTVQATATDAQNKANDVSAQGLFEMAAVGAPSGFSVSLSLAARLTIASILQQAGLFIDLTSSTSRVRIVGNQVVVQDNSGNIVALFSNGKIAAGRLDAGIINAQQLFLAGVPVVATGSILTNNVTAVETTPGNNITVNLTTVTNLGNIVSDTISVAAGQAEQWVFLFHCDQTRPGSAAPNNGSYSFALYDNGVLVPGSTPVYFYDDNFVSNPLIMTAKDVSAGSHAVTVQCNVSPDGGQAQFNFQNLFLTVLRCKR